MILNVTDKQGKKHALEAVSGWRAMEVIRDHGLPIKAECGGALACATCHVYVDGKWTEKLPAPDREELEMLDGAFEVAENSRLSCQIILNEDIDGLELTLAPGSEP